MYATLTLSPAGSLQPGDVFKFFLTIPSDSSFGPFTVLTVARLGNAPALQVTVKEWDNVMSFLPDTPVEILENV